MTRTKQKKTLSINMLHIEEEYETPIDSNFYQNLEDFFSISEQNIMQKMTDYTKQELKKSLSTKNISKYNK